MESCVIGHSRNNSRLDQTWYLGFEKSQTGSLIEPKNEREHYVIRIHPLGPIYKTKISFL